METSSSCPHELRFSAFAVDLQAGELRKHGAKIRLQEQPFQMLLALLERPGEVVMQEELRQRLWPGNTNVDFEQSLATAVKKLRRALGDPAVDSQFIETLPGRGYRFIGALEAEARARKPILAVLPFENLTCDAGQEYLSDGIAEEMIARLGRLLPQRLGVIALASARRYKNTDKDIDQIGRELSADSVLKGSVRRAGDRARITVELIQAKDRTRLWADSFEGEWANVPATYSEFARHIARSLQVEMGPAKDLATAGASTTNAEAHQAFLKGRYCLNKGTAEGTRSAIAHFEEATSTDSRYAVASAGLAVALNLADHFRVFSGKQAFPRAKAAAIKAMEINDLLPEAHNALAFVKHSFDWDWAGAEQSYQRAIALNPNFATARHWHGFYFGILGRLDEAIAEMRRAQDLNPLSLIIRTHLGLMMHLGRRYDEAIEQFRQVLEMEPDFGAAHYYLGRAYEQKGMYKKTITHLQKALVVSPGSPDRVGALAHAHAVYKRRGYAEGALKELHKLSEQRFVSAYDFAIVYVGLDEADQAFEWLGRAYEERSFSMLKSLKAEPRLDNLRLDPRFKDLVRRVGLPL